PPPPGMVQPPFMPQPMGGQAIAPPPPPAPSGLGGVGTMPIAQPIPPPPPSSQRIAGAAPAAAPAAPSQPRQLTAEQNALKTKILERAENITSQNYFQ